MKIELKKPLIVGDKTITEVSIDTDAITGKDIMFCIREAGAAGGVVVSYRTDTEVHLQMAAKLSGLDRDVIESMKGTDFINVLKPVQDFFLSST
jgi:hypothetical protein